MEAQILSFAAELRVELIRPDGTHYDYGLVAGGRCYSQPVGFWRALWRRLRREAAIPLSMGFAAFLAWMLHRELGAPGGLVMALVTDAGVDFMANDFANQGAGFDVTNFNFHESGTGTTAEAVGDTDLNAKISLARVAGTQSHPATKQFQSAATIAYTSTLTIAEWGLFSASGSGLPPTGGTLWDRRRVSPTVGVNNLDQISFTYKATAQSGGS